MHFRSLMKNCTTQQPSSTGKMADTEIQQLVKEIILQIVSNVVNILEITDNPNE